jgi:hypothetical protein
VQVSADAIFEDGALPLEDRFIAIYASNYKTASAPASGAEN